MSTSRFLGVMAILSIAIATPGTAQQVISEPGYCAFFYPNANCLNKGPGNPYTDPNFHRNQGAQSWSSGETLGMAAKRPQRHRPASSAARMQ
jgi:hypothetical protein